MRDLERKYRDLLPKLSQSNDPALLTKLDALWNRLTNAERNAIEHDLIAEDRKRRR